MEDDDRYVVILVDRVTGRPEVYGYWRGSWATGNARRCAESEKGPTHAVFTWALQDEVS